MRMTPTFPTRPNPRLELGVSYFMDGDSRPDAWTGPPVAHAYGFITSPALAAGCDRATIADLLRELLRDHLWPQLEEQLNNAAADPRIDPAQGGETAACARAIDSNGRPQGASDGGWFHLCGLDELTAEMDDIAGDLHPCDLHDEP